MQTLIDSDSKVNAMTLAYVVKLDLTIQKTSIKAEKIDGSLLAANGIASAKFLLQRILERIWFFEETIILVNTSMKVILKMSFLFFSKANIEFTELEKLTWRSYTTIKALPITSWIEIIDKRIFTKAILDKNPESFVI